MKCQLAGDNGARKSTETPEVGNEYWELATPS